MARAANSCRIAEQRTGSVGVLEHDDRRLVVTGRRRDPSGRNGHEAGGVVGVVLDPGHERLEPVPLAGEGIRQRGHARVAGLCHELGRAGRRVHRPLDRLGQRLVQEPTRLAERHGHRRHGLDAVERRAGHAEQLEANRHDDLALDVDVDVERHRVDRDVDHPLDAFSIATTPTSTAPSDVA